MRPCSRSGSGRPCPVIDLLQIDDVLDVVTREEIRREMHAAPGEPATVLGTTPEQRLTSAARKATGVEVSEAARAAIY